LRRHLQRVPPAAEGSTHARQGGIYLVTPEDAVRECDSIKAAEARQRNRSLQEDGYGHQSGATRRAVGDRFEVYT
jgi:hypothetical protein